ncbi:MAG: zinc-dependent peptidase, partial [Bacteroidetes bacterium]|nr:zinc-dependent peptidase [Bacteroidota bacterium]
MVEIIFLIIAGIFMTAAIGIGFLIIFGNFFIVMLQPVAERINSYLLRFNLRKVNPGYIKILEKYFYYYKNLTPAYQRRFEQRVRVFITSKKFISKDMETVTEEMKVLIAASAIQLTFGLSLFTLTHFIKIIVHPDSYHYSPRSKVKFQGHVTG